MTSTFSRRLPRLAATRWLLLLTLISPLTLQPSRAEESPSTAPAEGLRQNTPQVHALVGARIVTAPGRVIEEGIIVLRDGLVESVGADVDVPADARRWDVSGKTIYAGLIDAYSEFDGEVPLADGNGAAHWNPEVRPHAEIGPAYEVSESLNKKFRSQGIAARLVAPSQGIVKGTSALVHTGDADGSQAILQSPVALHTRLTPHGRRRDNYPNSPMGAVALNRQVFYDARWYNQAWELFESRDRLPRPERNDALAALRDLLADNVPVIVDAPNELYALRADRLGTEFGLNVIIRGSGNEYRRLDAIQSSGRAVIVPVDFPHAPDVRTPEAARNATLESLLHWDLAPENPGRLAEAGVRFALTSHGLKDRGEFLEAVRKAVRRGLPEDDALRALTLLPAELYGVENRLGSIEPGKMANLLVTDGDLFAKETRVIETWVDGRRYEVTPSDVVDPRGTWDIGSEADAEEDLEFEVLVSGRPGEWKAEVRTDDEKVSLDHVALRESQLAGHLPGKLLGLEGVVQISGTLVREDDKWLWMGALTIANGQRIALRGSRVSSNADAEETATNEDTPDASEGDDGDAASIDEDEDEPDEPSEARYGVNYPLGAFGRQGSPVEVPAVVFENATVWTCGPEGVLEKASVLVENGQITAVGTDIEMPANAIVIDAAGKHLTPGIIDCHSHIATDGGVNESGQAITAEVRIGDFINCDDINIYRQLAGGVTSSNILHGSANPIGGQNQVIKMRWGAGPEEMKFAEAPAGIKFALGENVKQSNWGDNYTTRYPQSRMGVEQIIQDAFEAARIYELSWRRWRTSQQGLPPRVDLELAALAEVLSGERLIHCHSYRQDEILALIRTCDRFGVRIGSLQHILEGYKVAEAMRAHGVGGSSFSDWWAYKFEVYDAIPYNGALMHRVGIVVSFNSDNAELGRRLNLEAAKAVKYGGIEPAEALKFVTLNPAIQLGIDEWVGSIEPGKHADLVLWSGPPLSSYSRCEQTWIDGRKYFDRAEDEQARRETAAMRAALIQRVLSTKAPTRKPDDGSGDSPTLWPDHDEFCPHCASR